MASKYLFQSRAPSKGAIFTYESDVTIVASTATQHVIDLPPGNYYLAMLLQSVANANNSVTLVIAPYMDSTQVEVGANMGFLVSGANSPVATITQSAAAGTTNSYLFLLGGTPAVPAVGPVTLAFGARITTTTGAGTATGAYSVRVMAEEV